MESNLSCMNCSVAACEYPERQKPGFCSQDCATDTLHDEALRLYALPENHAIMQAAVKVTEDTANSTRVQDTIKFARLIGAERIGIATCTIMLRETRILARLLSEAGFHVEAIGCKVDSNRRTDLDLEPLESGEGPVLCNPIMQALLLNEAKTDLNVLMGLCVGHDALFCKILRRAHHHARRQRFPSCEQPLRRAVRSRRRLSKKAGENDRRIRLERRNPRRTARLIG